MSEPYYQRGGITLYCGDNREVLPLLDTSVSAVITDPPYGLSKEPDIAEVLTHWLAGDDYTHGGGGFMGKSWDSFVPGPATWRLVADAMLPGAHLCAFAGTRTSDLMGMAIRLAGLARRDTACWLMGSGFPKSLDVGKAIDKVRDRSKLNALSAEVKRARSESGLSLAEIGRAMLDATSGQYGSWYHRGGHMFFETGMALPSRPEWEHLFHVLPLRPEFEDVYAAAEREVIGPTRHDKGGRAVSILQGNTDYADTAPATPEAQQWDGWGTALKPAHEDIGIYRKPFPGTVAANVLAHGTGAINVDGTRVGTETIQTSGWTGMDAQRFRNGTRPKDYTQEKEPQPSLHTGRWPPNVIMDPEAAALLDAMSGVSKSTKAYRGGSGWQSLDYQGNPDQSAGLPTNSDGYNDSGGSSRFFPVLPVDDPDTLRFMYCAKAPRSQRLQSSTGVSHPTQKPEALMRWLLTLVTPPNGAVVLDPFAGSGSTLVAAAQLGIAAIGIEMDESYCEIAARRIDHAINERERGAVFGNGTDASRATSVVTNHARSAVSAISKGIYGDSQAQETHQTEGQKLGRWPSNVIMDKSAAALLDAQSGERPSRPGSSTSKSRSSAYGMSDRQPPPSSYIPKGDTGGASRFMTVIDDGDEPPRLAQMPLEGCAD